MRRGEVACSRLVSRRRPSTRRGVKSSVWPRWSCHCGIGEKVAALRRDLPVGTVVEDYAFLEGPRTLADGDTPVTTVRLRQLFSGPDRALVVYHAMYGKRQTTPCPMCTMWVDGLNGVVRHLQQNVDFVVASAAEPAALRAHGRDRGWDNVRLLSCGDSTFQYDLGAEDEDGEQDSTVSVFVLDEEGRPAPCLQRPPTHGRRH